MLGYLAALTPEEVKQPASGGEAILSAEPAYVGQPIVAIAAETERAAANAIVLIELDLTRLPFVVDPLESLKPDRPNALESDNVM